jgi:hypothetical protein
MNVKFKSQSEKLFASYLDNLDLGWDYEKEWETKKPDFTIYSNLAKKKIIAVAEVEDMDFTPEEKKQVKENKMVARSMDPYAKLREKINTARGQLRYSKGYHCLLIIGESMTLSSPAIVYGAMLGDITITIPIRNGDVPSRGKPQSYFGKRGKMIDRKGQRIQNTTITAIGFLRLIRPDAITSGYEKELSKILDKLDIKKDEDNQKYFRAAKRLKSSLSKKGFDVNKTKPSVNFFVNPFSRMDFPKKPFSKPYSYVYTYNLKSGKIKLSYDWSRKIVKL